MTPKGSARTLRVIFATDAYTRYLMHHIRRQQLFLPYFKCATRPLHDDVIRSNLPRRQGVWNTREVLSCFRVDR